MTMAAMAVTRYAQSGACESMIVASVVIIVASVIISVVKIKDRKCRWKAWSMEVCGVPHHLRSLGLVRRQHENCFHVSHVWCKLISHCSSFISLCFVVLPPRTRVTRTHKQPRTWPQICTQPRASTLAGSGRALQHSSRIWICFPEINFLVTGRGLDTVKNNSTLRCELWNDNILDRKQPPAPPLTPLRHSRQSVRENRCSSWVRRGVMAHDVVNPNEYF